MISHFHPILVHLPLGILPLVALFHFISKKPSYRYLSDAITLSLLIALVLELLSCITGYMLSLEGGYPKDMLDAHLNSGLLTTVLTMGWLYVHKSPYSTTVKNATVLVCMTSLLITGHRGGSLTHGENYLFSSDAEASETKIRKPLVNVDSALVYNDIVQPILEEKCVSCHGARKQKGKLRLDQPEKIMAGGENGVPFKWGDAANSDLIRRIHLPDNDDDRMPPKGKKNLTAEEAVLLGWWIGANGGFDKKVYQLSVPDSIKPALESLKKAVVEKQVLPALPEEKVEAADPAILEKFKANGLVVVPVAAGSNYLSVTAGPEFKYNGLDFLQPLLPQLLELKLSRLEVKDEALLQLKGALHLQELVIDHSSVTDAGMESIAALQSLRKLNLVGTKVTSAGVLKLSGLKQLQVCYLHQSGVKGSDWANLKKALPSVRIDTGGYLVPFMETDTQVVQAPVIKK